MVKLDIKTLRSRLSKSKYVHTVYLPLFLSAAVVLIVAAVLISNTVSASWRRTVREERMREATRYANYLASEISLAGTEHVTESGEAGSSDSGFFDVLSEETEALFERFSYMRVMVLDTKGLVRKDSSQTKTGSYVMNDDVLLAISGEVVSVREGNAGRIAVPLQNTTTDETVGLVYLLVDLSSVADINGNSARYFWQVPVITILCIAVLCALIWLLEKPLQRILQWIIDLKLGEKDIKEVDKPEIKGDNEYTRIVDNLDELTHDLLAVDRSRKEFVSNVSHELKTPLSSIKVLTESLLLQDNVPEEIYKEFLQDINSEIDRMNGIVNDLLTLVRLEEGENVLNLTTFSLGDMAEDILKRMRPLADQRDITLSCECVRPVEIEADETKLTLALTNLVQNGIKYNKNGGQVRVRIDSNQLYALIVVSDTGIGIEEKHYEKLFQRFYRVDTARDRQAGGSGLGLSIVRQVLTLHKGTISVSSVVGEGTSFSIKMPLLQSEPEEEEEK